MQPGLFDEPIEFAGGKPVLLDVQSALLESGRLSYGNGVRRVIWQAPCGAGKCLGYGTPVLMFDGTIKPVQDVAVGDLLMGPDSCPRLVLSTCSGREELFRVMPTKGDPYVVNRSHILSVRPYGKTSRFGTDPINISVDDWLAQTKDFRWNCKGWRSGIQWPVQGVILNPYFLGLWLGDGTRRCAEITTQDREIIGFLKVFAGVNKLLLKRRHDEGKCDRWAITNGFRGGIAGKQGAAENRIYSQLRSLGVTQRKHVPLLYKANCPDVQKAVLAGLLDSDGSLSSGGYDFIAKYRQLADDVAFLARSLGLAAYVKQVVKTCGNNGVKGIYYRVSISGDCSIIPCHVWRKRAPRRTQIKNVLLTAIQVESIGEGDYYGFEISGDGLFMLGDFTVTHNTIVGAEQTCRALSRGKTVLHVVHRRRLVDQMVGTLKRFGVNASPVMDGRRRWDSPVMCASRDTLLAMLKAGTPLPRADLLVIDECHVAATAILDWYLRNCPDAYWTGYTATPVCSDGRSLAPPYQALVCMCPTSKLLEIGRLCRVKVFNPDAVGQRRRKGDKVKPVGDPIDHWKKYALNQPTVVFAATVSESKRIAQRYTDAGFPAEHLDASTPEDVREAVFERSRLGVTKVICNCAVLIEGVDLPWLVCCQILRGCNSLVLFIQATGRVMRSFPGKEHGIVLDHAGAAHEFGLPDSDFVWTLEDEKSNARRNKPARDQKPVACTACGAVFVGRDSCPECGRVIPKQRRKSVVDSAEPGDGVLTEFTGVLNGHVQKETLRRVWNKYLYIGRAKDWPMGNVAGAFTRATKIPPWEADLDVPLPGKGHWSIPVRQWMEQHA